MITKPTGAMTPIYMGKRAWIHDGALGTPYNNNYMYSYSDFNFIFYKKIAGTKSDSNNNSYDFDLYYYPLKLQSGSPVIIDAISFLKNEGQATSDIATNHSDDYFKIADKERSLNNSYNKIDGLVEYYTETELQGLSNADISTVAGTEKKYFYVMTESIAFKVPDSGTKENAEKTPHFKGTSLDWSPFKENESASALLMRNYTTKNLNTIINKSGQVLSIPIFDKNDLTGTL